MSELTPGHATSHGTHAFAARALAAVPATIDSHHMRALGDLAASSIGLGTYLGDTTDDADAAYERAILAAIAAGVNVIDTAVNYRYQRSERAIGRALAKAFARGGVTREEIIVATKGGFVPFDRERPPDPAAYIRERYIDSGLIEPADLIAGCHALAPAYIEDQIATSRRNLGLATIDIYYLHNPETQLSELSRARFLERMRAAFATLEAAVARGHIRAYGTATWAGYRVPPDHRDHLSLRELVEVARAVGGADHHFRVIQLPYSLSMREAAVDTYQDISGENIQLSEKAPEGDLPESMSILEAAAILNIYVMGSAPLFQGRLTAGLPDELDQALPGLASDAQRALQFARSSPGLGTALVGMSSAAHVRDNCAVARVPPVSAMAIAALHFALDAD